MTGSDMPAPRDVHSTPAAMYWSPSPALIAWKAMRIVCSDEAQKRLTVTAGTWWSRPASSTALRPTL
jgi:hypothetical protein